MERDSPEGGKGEGFMCPQSNRDLYTVYYSVTAPEKETRIKKLKLWWMPKEGGTYIVKVFSFRRISQNTEVNSHQRPGIYYGLGLWDISGPHIEWRLKYLFSISLHFSLCLWLSLYMCVYFRYYLYIPYSGANLDREGTPIMPEVRYSASLVGWGGESELSWIKENKRSSISYRSQFMHSVSRKCYLSIPLSWQVIWRTGNLLDSQ